MAVALEAFIALEESLALRLSSTADILYADTYKAIEQALDQQDWDQATALVQTLDMAPVFEVNEPYIQYLSQVAILFGASRVSRNPKTTVVGLGFEKDTVALVVQSFKQQITLGAGDYLKDSALQLIALTRNPPEKKPRTPDSAYLGTVLKAAKAPAVVPFASFMDKQGKSFFNMASSLHTSRLSAFGFTAEANFLGITEYQINEQLDGRTCPVCAVMHGKTFQVKDARNLLDTVIRTQDPQELKNLQPWPSQSATGIALLKTLSQDDLVAAGWHVPPFHPRCRGLLVKSRTAPPLEPGKKPEPVSEDYEASKEDFEQLGIQLSPAKIKTWNTLVNKAPSEIVARLSGTTQAELLELLTTTDKPQDAMGLATLTVTPTRVNVEIHKPVFGATKPVVQDYYWRKDGSVFVGSIDVQPEDSQIIPKLLRNLYGTAKQTPANALVMRAGGEVGGAEWAKYGLIPSNWAEVKAQVKRNIKAKKLLEDAPLDEIEKLNLLLASDDPESIFALRDLPTLGPLLLEGTDWMGRLPFDNETAVKRFVKEMK